MEEIKMKTDSSPEILRTIKPTAKQQKEVRTAVKRFIGKLNATLKGAAAILGGSGAKGTWLSSNHDIDIFVKFKKTVWKDRPLSDALQTALRQAFPKQKISRIHGSRDYFQLAHEGFVFEVVPILDIKKAEEAENITDISPLHAIWVKKNVREKDEVLLIKQFCRAHGMYGAESYISGFSGYVLEILIGHYKNFENVLKASLAWKLKEVIDPEKHYKKNKAVFFLNKSKQQSPLIVVDPVDKNRNAAAALSEEKFQLFRRKAKEYLKYLNDPLSSSSSSSPLSSFFEKKEIDLDKLKKQGYLIIFNVVPLSGKKDVIGAKLLKAFEFLKKELSPFMVKKAIWDWDTMYFVLAKDRLPDKEVRPGPPSKMKEHVKNFKKKNKDTFTKDGRIYANVKVKHTKLKTFVEHLIKDKYVKGKVKDIFHKVDYSAGDYFAGSPHLRSKKGIKNKVVKIMLLILSD